MKFTIVYQPDCLATQELIEENFSNLNENFRNEDFEFFNFYRKIPEAVRKKLPWNNIIEFRANAIIIDNYEITELKPVGDKQCFQITINFNETTMEAFSLISKHLGTMGVISDALTRKALKRKVRKAIETLYLEKEKRLVGHSKILNYWEGEEN